MNRPIKNVPMPSPMTVVIGLVGLARRRFPPQRPRAGFFRLDEDLCCRLNNHELPRP